MLTLAEYKRKQMLSAGVSPEYIEAVRLQDDIRILKDTLRKKWHDLNRDTPEGEKEKTFFDVA